MKRTKRFTAILLAAVLLGGCGQVSQGETKQSTESTSEQLEGVIEKELSDLYGTKELFTETLGDIEFNIPQMFREDIKESGEWKYYYYEDLMLAVNATKESGMTNEEFINYGVDSFVDGMVESLENGRLIHSDIIETKIGKAIKLCMEHTINEKECIFYCICFLYGLDFYNLGFMEEKDSKWDRSQDFDCLIDSIVPKGKAGFTGEQIQIFSSDFQSFKGWFVENSSECVYSERNKIENTETHKTSTGVVSDSSSVIEWIDFIQKAEDGYSAQSADTKGIILENSNKFSDFQDGDGIKIYYYINADNETEILAMEKIEPEFTIEDYVNAYKEQCKEYTYKEIARNPDSVKGEYAKLTGEVIQVLESGTSVTLRVDITKDKYGYYSDTVYVKYTRKSDTEDRILEDDIITIYGKLGGIETYTSVLGAEVSLPKIFAEYIELVEE